MFTFNRFAIVGGVGFVVDASIFYLFKEYLSLPYSTARIFAFIFAMIITWLGNRYFTFIDANRADAQQQLMKHCCCASLSFVFNYATFQVHLLLSMPLAVAFVAGVLVGMFSNYFISKRLIFV